MNKFIVCAIFGCFFSHVWAAPIEVSAGAGATCALDQIGIAFCWGSNNDGMLGDGTLSPAKSPVRVHGGGRGHRSISSGSRACKVDIGGYIHCWGRNDDGQFGDPGGPDLLLPVPIMPGSNGFIEVSVARTHACAVRGNGGAFCWGVNEAGSLGSGGPYNERSTGVAVDIDVPLASITSGRAFSCGISFEGDAYCWGKGQYGRLGNGSQADKPTPELVALPSGAAQISAGEYHACAVLINGSLYCWGYNIQGQLGIGNYVQKLLPTKVTGIPGSVVQLEVGFFHTCAINSFGVVYCWGRNDRGQIGNDAVENSNFPMAVSGIENASAVSAGILHTCAVAGGELYCWGANGDGALGNGTTTDSATPVRVDLGPYIFVDSFNK